MLDLLKSTMPFLEEQLPPFWKWLLMFLSVSAYFEYAERYDTRRNVQRNYASFEIGDFHFLDSLSYQG